MRQHGLESPFEPAQVCAWILAVLSTAMFVCMISPALGLNAGLAAIFVYLSILLCVLASGYLATRIDTIDPYLNSRSIPRDQVDDSTAQRLRRSLPVHLEWCYNCRWYVSKDSYHCKRCDKCSKGLDHHCTFLNNCIAEPNYSMFFISTLGACLLCATQLSLSILVLVLSYLDYTLISSNLCTFYLCSSPSISPTALHLLLILHAAISLTGTILTGHLLAFHIFLISRNQLTHQFLLGEHSSASSHLPSSTTKQIIPPTT